MSVRKRRWYQFNIRGLLMLTTLVAIGFGFWVSGLHRKHQALNSLRALKAHIQFGREPKSRLGELWNRVLKLAGEDYASEPLAIFIVSQRYPPLNDAALQSLADLPGLKRLSLMGSPVGDEGMPYLPRLQNLEQLELSLSRADDLALANLSGLAKLRSLGLGGTQVSDEGMKWLPGLSQLTGLGLDRTKVGDESLKLLARIPRLESLSLEKTLVTGSGFTSIARWPTLKELDLSATALADDGLMKLPHAPALESLKLNDTSISDAGMRRIARLTALRTLELRNTKITGDSLAYLQTLPRLTYLDLAGTRIGDDDIDALNELCPLVAVSLADTNVTQTGLANLQVIGSLDRGWLGGLAEETEIDVDRRPLCDVIDYLKARHGCEIQLDGRLVERQKYLQPATCHVRGVTLWRGLQELVGPLGLEVVFRYSVPYITERPAKPARGIPDLAVGETPSASLTAVLGELTEIDFASQPLSDVLDYLTQRHSREIHLDGDSLRRVNQASDVPVTRTIRGIPLRSALGLILEPLDLKCVAEGDMLVIRSAPP